MSIQALHSSVLPTHLPLDPQLERSQVVAVGGSDQIVNQYTARPLRANWGIFINTFHLHRLVIIMMINSYIQLAAWYNMSRA